ncbi:maltose alpha-D-glucosyltransferase [Inquilinus sp. Marseille-Q2685]|uniref:maltose alpha-D-glucosyltransferase n=1 Tax=Inquilinus sp. Marseille-Q2685 TaxID=2866581 RepID=UPI001CE40D03|nr:maltose alpha-D-glucosyltransferase [Inquilinus sp. Marseille-Q2685]
MLKRSPAPGFDDPTWYKDAVIYQLHVKSFFDSNDDGIGDFKGLISKLDYIASLGVDTLWLLPFYPSPRRDDGYDIAAYTEVHPDYGTLADVRRFIAEAHRRGLRVITELVINHTSDQHPWFQRARRAKPGSSARNFYVWSDTDQAYAGTRIIFLDTETSNWTWDPVAGAYFWHRFYSHQPDLNFDNPRVLASVLRVMRFWLDLGVDGLRLDAIPYLIEREGTSNENLPETHAVLKQIRAHLDARYPGRMLLAEANQWPEDTQEYFGRGDECHMAFHFPLMPRMYMAIAREDRFPITDILRQTPEIPETCQWAIFLRNHDELTLEMVTDSERDYLWETYAADRRARINLGIRRRLSPLLERDRRRMELMSSLLLSMPGTPVLYYGDEIGMGDNIHLGDRDGVRTPMQWSPDRNGGFSRADPEKLVLPAIMDALYGFPAVNVESQGRDPHSLLNWTRRMLALRRRHRAFGRGTLRFLYPGNRKILAYLRSYEDETILCVANLSRAPQAVELDLADFEGRSPVELTGDTVFPPIGQLTYLLTLPPYGFYWFQLRADAAAPRWHQEPPEQMPEFVTLVLRDGLADVLSPASRKILETESLPAYLPKRRWFAAKDRRIDEIRIAKATPLPGTELMLAQVEATAGGTTDCYQVPLGIAWEDGSLPALQQQLAVARVRRGRRVGFLTDAFSLRDLPLALVNGLQTGQTLPAEDGEIRFLPTTRMEGFELPPDVDVQWLAAEQSNSSLVLGGDKLVLKLLRRIRPGIHPESEMGRYLTEHGATNIAPLFGEVVRIGADGEPRTLAIAQGFVRNQGDGWSWSLDNLRRTVDEMTLTEGATDGEGFADEAGFAAAIGRRLAEIHAVLARPSDDPAFAPEPADAAAVRGWIEEARVEIDGAIATVAAMRDWPDAATEAAARRLLEGQDRLARLVERLADAGRGSLQTRVHGDFHLGQVLVAQGDAYLIDFEGEPTRPIAERRHKSSPLRDVAGLLRSIDYAAATADDAIRDSIPEAMREQRTALLQRYRAEASQAFLEAYRAVARVAPHPWATPEAEEALIALFSLQKAAYEIRYEAANRPSWIGLPIRGLAALLDQLATDAKVLTHA